MERGSLVIVAATFFIGTRIIRPVALGQLLQEPRFPAQAPQQPFLELGLWLSPSLGGSWDRVILKV